MTDKATMPEYKTYDLKANIRTYIPDFDMASEIMVRLQTLDSLAAVAGRMAEALAKTTKYSLFENIGRGEKRITLTAQTIADCDEALEAYNALAQSTQSPVEQPPQTVAGELLAALQAMLVTFQYCIDNADLESVEQLVGKQARHAIEAATRHEGA